MAAEMSKEIEIKTERKKLKRELTLLPLFGLIYFTVCGGAFGAEPIIGWSGPGMALLLLLLTPILFSIPIMLMVRELQSMMPVEGGYYHWIKQGLGGFAGFMSGWLMWVVSWLDVSIYPVWATYYLSFLFPALSEGATVGGIYLDPNLLQFFTAALLIWAISLLQIRGTPLIRSHLNLDRYRDDHPFDHHVDRRFLFLDQERDHSGITFHPSRYHHRGSLEYRYFCGDVELHGLGIANRGG